MRAAIGAVRNNRAAFSPAELVEERIDPVLKFSDATNIRTTIWVTVHSPQYIPETNKRTHCAVEVRSQVEQVTPQEECNDVPPLMVCSFDGEMQPSGSIFDGKIRRGFPNAALPNDFISCVALRFERLGTTETPPVHVILCIGYAGQASDEGTLLLCFDDERELLETFGDLVKLAGGTGSVLPSTLPSAHYPDPPPPLPTPSPPLPTPHATDPAALIPSSTFSVDVYTGFNIAFDWNFLHVRAKIHNCVRFFTAGAFVLEECKLYEKQMDSKGKGSNDVIFMQFTGSWNIDTRSVIQANYKMPKFSLQACALKFLGTTKVDLPYEELFDLVSAADMNRVVEYCIGDVDLPMEMLRKLFMVEGLVELSRVSKAPFIWLVTRGEQSKYLAKLHNFAHANGHWLDTIPPNADERFQGATVLDPKPGFYTDALILTLDFASLYPTIMMSHNLSHETRVDEKKVPSVPEDIRVTYALGEERTHTFIKPEVYEGILGRMLNDTLAQRRVVKQKMKSVDGMMKVLLDKRQQALKITANSMYGACGAGAGGVYPCTAISETTTFLGRQLIETTKTMVEMMALPQPPDDVTWTGDTVPRVVYGDSVTGDTPLLLKLPTGAISVSTFASIVADGAWTAYENFKPGEPGRTHKQQALMQDVLVWACDRWTPVVRVIRHKTRKRIVRVVTHTGVVDCTEDHSLLTADGEPIKPVDCAVGTHLLHGLPPVSEFAALPDSRLPAERAFLMGCFMGDGSCGEYDCPSGKKARWYIGKNDPRLLERCGRAMAAHEGVGFKILDTNRASQTPRLVPVGEYGAVKALVHEYRSLFYDAFGRKCIPPYVLNASEASRRSFLAGFYATDGDKTSGTRLDQRGQVGCQGLVVLLHSLGHTVSINTRSDKPDIFRMTWFPPGGGKHVSRRSSIKKLHTLRDTQRDEFVYDVETAEGYFNAGVGALTVKNTDSVMVKLPVYMSLENAYEWGKRAAAEITRTFPGNIELELEDVMHPFLLIMKKRYAARKFTETKSGAIEPSSTYDYKGIELKRQDIPMVLKRMQSEALDQILVQYLFEETSDGTTPAWKTAIENGTYVEEIERAKGRAFAALSARLDDIVDGKVPLEEFVLYKSLARQYKNLNQPHIKVVQKKEERCVGSGESVNERVAFYYRAPTEYERREFKTKRLGANDFAEDPEYGAAHDIPPDYERYIELCSKALVTMLTPVYGAHDTRVKALFDDALRRLEHKRTKQSTITKFFGASSSSSGTSSLAALVPSAPRQKRVTTRAPPAGGKRRR